MFPFDLDPYAKLPGRRQRLWIEAGKRCHWCNRETRLTEKLVRDQATIDHVIPRHKGGTNALDNVVSACLECNRRRNMEDQMGLQEGHLLKKFEMKEGPVTVKADTVLRDQRDKAVAEIVKLRQELQRVGRLEAKVDELELELAKMTFRRLFLLKLKRWVAQYV